VESSGVDGLEAGPLSPELPVRNNGWGNGGAQLLFVGEDASGIIGSEDGRGNTSEPTDEVVVVLTGLLTTEETARGKVGGDSVEDQVADVGDVAGGCLEESVLGLFGDLVLVDLEEAAVFWNLLLVEGLELGSFGGSRDALEGSLTWSMSETNEEMSSRK